MNVQGWQPPPRFPHLPPASGGRAASPTLPLPQVRLARALDHGPQDRRIPLEDIVPVGRRKPKASDPSGEPEPHPSAPGERPRLTRLARILIVTLAAEVFLSGAYRAAVQWNKTRGIAVPITETDRSAIT